MMDNPEDQAFFEKCKIIDFPITFVENPKNDNEKKIDVSLKENFKNLRQYFILILLEYYKIYKIEGLIIKFHTQNMLKHILKIKYLNVKNILSSKSTNNLIPVEKVLSS